MAVAVAKIELKTVQDASGLEALVTSGKIQADQVVAVVGKTEGNGGVNDFTRILADQAFRRVLEKHGRRSAAEVAEVPMVWSGGCDGVITPHATVFAQDARTGPTNRSRLVIGTSLSEELLPEDIGRPAMVEKVAAAVRAAMKAAGIGNPKDVHYVQTKTPLLTIDAVQDAHQRGKSVACEVHESMGVSNGTTALGIAVALGEAKMPKAEQICHDLDLYSSVASCSSGVELTRAQIVLLGNKAGAGGRYRIGHSVMKDALDLDGIYAAIRDAGLELPERPRAEDLKGKLVNCFIKCEADRSGKLRGRRQIMLDDSDVHHHRHAKAAVGAVAAAAIGDPAVFVSVDAMHQGPQGGGPVIAIVDLGEWSAAHITVRGLSKTFGGAQVYERFELDIARGEFVSVFGPNGCGKSTLINLIAGLIVPDGGEILFGGKRLAATKIGYVFQNYREALFPWLTAWANIEYPLKLMKLDAQERRARVGRLVARLGIKIDLARYPYELSGGQQQLVSILRALVVEPEVLFLDEPFSALDYEMTLFMREQLQRLFLETRTTTVLVSHDLEEAVYLADRVLLLTRRPARIADDVPLRLARPRSDDTLSDPDFVRLKGHCLEVFQREVRRA